MSTSRPPFTVLAPANWKRTLVVGNTLKRQRKGDLSKKKYPWAIVQDVITADPAHLESHVLNPTGRKLGDDLPR